LYESAPGRDVRGIADDLGIEDGPLRGWLETLGTGKKAAADGTLTRSPGPLQHDKRRRRRLGGNLPDRDLPAQRLRVARPDRLRLGVDDHPLVPTGTRSRPAARRRRLRDKRQASQGSGVQGAERRLASLRAGILSALPACGPVAPDQGHLHHPHRIPPLCRRPLSRGSRRLLAVSARIRPNGAAKSSMLRSTSWDVRATARAPYGNRGFGGSHRSRTPALFSDQRGAARRHPRPARLMRLFATRQPKPMLITR
jgi:hypothetical protein